MKSAPVFAAILLEGCAAGGVHSDWLPERTHPELRPYAIEVSPDLLLRACGDAPALYLHGCAVRVPEERLCIIYTTPKPESWVLEHERRHCAGWDHT